MRDNDYTLEQMRSDYQNFKEALEKQEIINDKLLRETMRTKVGSIRNVTLVSVLCALFVILAAPFVFHYNPVVSASWPFVIATEALMMLCMFLDLHFKHKVQEADFLNCDLLSLSRDVKEMKLRYQNWTKWGVTLGLLWGGWLCSEVWANSDNPKFAIAFISGFVLGLLSGMFIGWKMNRKIIRTCDEIISDIED